MPGAAGLGAYHHQIAIIRNPLLHSSLEASCDQGLLAGPSLFYAIVHGHMMLAIVAGT